VVGRSRVVVVVASTVVVVDSRAVVVGGRVDPADETSGCSGTRAAEATTTARTRR
jgi:hypothetical protein